MSQEIFVRLLIQQIDVSEQFIKVTDIPLQCTICGFYFTSCGWYLSFSTHIGESNILLDIIYHIMWQFCHIERQIKYVQLLSMENIEIYIIIGLLWE